MFGCFLFIYGHTLSLFIKSQILSSTYPFNLLFFVFTLFLSEKARIYFRPNRQTYTFSCSRPFFFK